MGNGKDVVTAGGSPSPSTAWSDYITPFAVAISMNVQDVAQKLKPIIGEANESAISTLQSEEYAPYEDIKVCLSDVATGVLRRAVTEHLRKVVAVEMPENSASFGSYSAAVLPPLPDDEAWLSALKTGGELRVTPTIVISGMRAALASQSGLYGLPKELSALMESHSESMDEPVGADYYKLNKLLTRRNYSEIFAALDNVDGTYATEGRKKKVLERLDRELWTALQSFQGQLESWTESWHKGAMNPAAMFAALAAMGGGGGAAMPPGMMQPPATDTLRDAAEGVNDRINGVFAGTSVPVVMALAYDAQNIKEVLGNATLPAQVGAHSRDQMLKMLKASVSSDYVRLERNISHYALAVMNLPKVPSGNEEHAYLGALLTLGGAIPWDQLSAKIPPRARRPRGASTSMDSAE